MKNHDNVSLVFAKIFKVRKLKPSRFNFQNNNAFKKIPFSRFRTTTLYFYEIIYIDQIERGGAVIRGSALQSANLALIA